MVDLDYVGNRIAALLIQYNMSQNDLDRRLGKYRGYTYNIVGVKYQPSLPSLYEICDAFHLSVSEFFDTSIRFPNKLSQSTDLLKKLDEDELDFFLMVLNRWNDNKAAKEKNVHKPERTSIFYDD